MKFLITPIIWLTALTCLFFLNPSEDGTSLCLFRFVGINWCPGCGIGHAIHFALHGQFFESIKEHWLGIPATAAILYQMIQPLYHRFYKKQNLWTTNT
jgi:hypothetical protein